MPLSDLPRELLFDIADYLDDTELNALACTNSNVYHLLNKQLYRQDMARPQSKSLAWASENGVEGTVKRAVDANRCFNPIPKSFSIALQAAAYLGHVRIVELLLQVDGINPNYMGSSLHGYAAPLLLRINRVRSAEMADCTPLIYACMKGYVSIVRQLLARDDVDVNAIGSGWTPLTAACEFCRVENLEIINLLLAQDGIDINLGIQTKPLITAVGRELMEVVESLLARDDLDPNIVDHDGESALGYAVFRWHSDVVRLLLNRPDIDVNRRDRFGRTALGRVAAICRAAASYFSFEAAELLLEREDTDINLPDNRGWTPLHCACKEDNLGVVDLLLEKDNIGINAKDNDGYTPLALACRWRSSIELVHSLLSHGADPNVVDNDDYTPLDLAWRSCNRIDIMDLLLSHGADRRR